MSTILMNFFSSVVWRVASNSWLDRDHDVDSGILNGIFITAVYDQRWISFRAGSTALVEVRGRRVLVWNMKHASNSGPIKMQRCYAYAV